ncbi:hypothetical protein E4U40_007329 [Claviceps sp. LM458 group G5]|nr:hypothetical protein E4U40_007329 [Claviceps sp. LM458 group G5]
MDVTPKSQETKSTQFSNSSARSKERSMLCENEAAVIGIQAQGRLDGLLVAFSLLLLVPSTCSTARRPAKRVDPQTRRFPATRLAVETQ